MFFLVFQLYLFLYGCRGDPSDSMDNATGTTSDNKTAVCIKGVNIGSFIIDQPNRTSILVVGSFAIIQWHYTPLVKNPPQKLDIKIQMIREGVQYTWDKYVVQGLELKDNATAYNWTIQPLLDGVYKLRMVPDGKETFNVPNDKMPCFSNGEALPATSGQFKIVNSVPLLAYPDPLPPNTSKEFKLEPLFFGLLWSLFNFT